MMVLIIKGNVDTWGIGTLVVVFKVVEAVIDTWIRTVVKFNDVLHGFCARRGTGTTIMEIKLMQELASADQNLIFLLFLYLSKA